MKILIQFKRDNRIGNMVLMVGIFLLFFFASVITGCKEFVTVDTLNDKLLSTQIFNSESTANSAIAGIYSTARTYFSGFESHSLLTAFSADDLSAFDNTRNNFQNNEILPSDRLPWFGLYKIIYQCNDAIEGLALSTIPAEKKNIFLGEAKFMRAFSYFFLVNLFGEVPLITNTDVAASAIATRTDVQLIYDQITKDLLDAQNLLTPNNIYSGGEKIRINLWTVKAMLARVYLYQKDWSNATKYSDEVIQSKVFSLTTIADVFKKNSAEAVFQLAISSTQNINETVSMLPSAGVPTLFCNPSLLNAFENNDNRKKQWLKSIVYSGNTYYYPNKYTSGGANPPEYYMLFRLAEQYLIRAEGKAMANDLQGAIDDVNLLREKHGGLLTALNVPASQAVALEIILHERRVELFTEQGHRWLDLKRLNLVDAIISAEKPGKWQSTDALWPIPQDDILKNRNLKQNPGYN